MRSRHCMGSTYRSAMIYWPWCRWIVLIEFHSHNVDCWMEDGLCWPSGWLLNCRENWRFVLCLELPRYTKLLFGGHVCAGGHRSRTVRYCNCIRGQVAQAVEARGSLQSKSHAG